MEPVGKGRKGDISKPKFLTMSSGKVPGGCSPKGGSEGKAWPPGQTKVRGHIVPWKDHLLNGKSGCQGGIVKRQAQQNGPLREKSRSTQSSKSGIP